MNNKCESRLVTPRAEANKAKWGKIAKDVVKDSPATQPNTIDADICGMQAMPIGQQISKYAENIAQVIQSAALIFDCLKSGRNALVHCSDGWDRTAQLTALVQVLADPYYRTCRGFAELIAKEFISFGHRFGSRCGNYKYCQKEKDAAAEWSPVFQLFVEAVFNLQQQNVAKFEFDEKFLEHILEKVYDRQTGTFLFDCEAD